MFHGAQIDKKFLAQYGDNALPKRSVHEWIEKFQGGRKSVKHSQGAEGPSSSTTDDDNSEQAQQMITSRPAHQCWWVSVLFADDHEFAYQTIHDNLGFRIMSARWLPRELTVDHKQRRLGICQLLNARPHAAIKLLKPLANWALKRSNTLLTAQILRFPTTISWVHSKMLCEVVGFFRRKQSVKRCTNVCMTSKKLSSQMEFTSP